MSTHQPHTLALAGFRLSVLGREFHDSHDTWDGNWLQVEAECTADGATARLTGPFVRVDEIVRLASAFEALSDLSSRKQEVDLFGQVKHCALRY